MESAKSHTVKCSLVRFVKDRSLSELLHLLVKRANVVIPKAYLLMNLHIRDLIENEIPVEWNDNGFYDYFSIVTGGKVTAASSEWKRGIHSTLTKHHDLVQPLGSGSNLLFHCAPLLAVQMRTAVENNIRVHYHRRLKMYTTLVCPHLDNRGIRQYLEDVYSRGPGWYPSCEFTPDRIEVSLAYDLERHPYRFLRPMYRMIRTIDSFLKEKADARRMGVVGWSHPVYGNPKKIRRFSLLPSKTSFVPQHIPVNDDVLQNLLRHTDDDTRKRCRDYVSARKKILDQTVLDEGKKRKRIDRSKGDVIKMDLWDRVFDLNAARRKKKEFGFYFTTDGVSVSVLWRDSEKKVTKRTKSTATVEQVLPSIDGLAGRMVVGVDPGRCSLMYFTSDEADFERPHKQIDFTSNRYRVESYRKGHRRKLLESMRTNVKSAESSMSKACIKVASTTDYLSYATQRKTVQDLLTQHYSHPKFRVWRWVRFKRKQRCLAGLVNQIKDTFGKDCVLAVGRWGTGNHHMTGRDPTPNIGLRNHLKQYFDLYVIPEFRTTVTCSRCKGTVSPPEFMLPSKKPKHLKPEYRRENGIKYVEVHGLRRCQNEVCGTHWNRDYNAAKNIRENFLHLVRHGVTHPAFTPRERPKAEEKGQEPKPSLL